MANKKTIKSEITEEVKTVTKKKNDTSVKIKFVKLFFGDNVFCPGDVVVFPEWKANQYISNGYAEELKC